MYAHRIVSVHDLPVFDEEYGETEGMLANLAQEGWELIFCVPVSAPRQDEHPREGHDNTVIAMHYYFRKPSISS